jgi:uncharacterized membrane protein
MIRNSIILALILTVPVYGQNCNKYVKACEETVKAQDKAIDNLKKSVKILKEEVEEAKPIAPSWVVLVGGIAIGVILHSTLKK